MLKDCATILFPVLGSDIFENKEPLLTDSISITSLAFERSVEFLRPCVATSAPIDKFVNSSFFFFFNYPTEFTLMTLEQNM